MSDQAQLPGIRERPKTAEVIAAFLISRKALNASAAYLRWLPYMLRHLAKAEYLPETRAEIDAIRSSLEPGRRGRHGPVLKIGDETAFDVHIAMQALFNWAAEEYGVPNPMKKLGKPRRRKKRPKTTDGARFQRLLEDARTNPRDYAIIQILFDIGPRIGEVTNLTRDNISPGVVRLLGKTGWHVVPISAATHRALMRIPYSQKHPDSLWIGQRGPLGVDGLKRIVTKRLRAAGFSQGGPHMLRHTFGKLWVMNGGSLVALQAILGHSKIEMTRKYADLDLTEVTIQHTRFSPAAQLYLVPDAGDQADTGTA